MKRDDSSDVSRAINSLKSARTARRRKNNSISYIAYHCNDKFTLFLSCTYAANDSEIIFRMIYVRTDIRVSARNDGYFENQQIMYADGTDIR